MREAKDMEYPVLVKYDNGSYWLHDLSDNFSYLDGYYFISIIE